MCRRSPSRRQLVAETSADTSRHCIILVKNGVSVTVATCLEMAGNLAWPREINPRSTADGDVFKLHKAKNNVRILVSAPTVRSFGIGSAALVCLNQPPTTILAALDGNLKRATAFGSDQVVSRLICPILTGHVAACMGEHARGERFCGNGNPCLITTSPA